MGGDGRNDDIDDELDRPLTPESHTHTTQEGRRTNHLRGSGQGYLKENPPKRGRIGSCPS